MTGMPQTLSAPPSPAPDTATGELLNADESAIEGANGDGSGVIIGESHSPNRALPALLHFQILSPAVSQRCALCSTAAGAVALLVLVAGGLLVRHIKKKRSASAGGGQVQVTMTQPGQSKEIPPSLESKVDTKPGGASASAAGGNSSADVHEPKKEWF